MARASKAITEIHGHPQMLAHCRPWLVEQFPGARLIECASSSAAAEEGGPGWRRRRSARR
jgi:prephenate dehydratase